MEAPGEDRADCDRARVIDAERGDLLARVVVEEVGAVTSRSCHGPIRVMPL
jgi:hypothetical protein